MVTLLSSKRYLAYNMTIYYCNSYKMPDVHRVSRILPKERMEKSLRLPLHKQPASLAAGMLLSYALLRVGESDNNVHILPSGKPVILDSSWHISLSHSGNHAVCGIHTKPIGIDIQTISLPRQSLIARVCSEQEVEYIANSSCPAHAFTCLWVLKESYVKLLGCGITENLRKISFDISSDKIIGPHGYSYSLCYEIDDAIVGICIEE